MLVLHFYFHIFHISLSRFSRIVSHTCKIFSNFLYFREKNINCQHHQRMRTAFIDHVRTIYYMNKKYLLRSLKKIGLSYKYVCILSFNSCATNRRYTGDHSCASTCLPARQSRSLIFFLHAAWSGV